MSDISASERRLSAALDRIDQLLEAGAARPAPPPPAAGTEELRAENDRLSAEIAALREAVGAGEAEAGLRAELESLRAERAAEQARMNAIMAELERLLGGEADGPPAEVGPDGDGGDRQQGEGR